jgi:hypothetical protein
VDEGGEAVGRGGEEVAIDREGEPFVPLPLEGSELVANGFHRVSGVGGCCVVFGGSRVAFDTPVYANGLLGVGV